MAESRFTQLRAAHPSLTFRSQEYVLTNQGLEVKFSFHLEPDIDFTTLVVFQGVTELQIARIGSANLEQHLFHLGLVDLLSYWKLACPQQIVIEAGQLTAAQIEWWDNLLKQGLGEFFFVNEIDPTQADLVNWTVAESAPALSATPLPAGDPTSLLIPMGGGKDSIVTNQAWAQTPLRRTGVIVNEIPSAKTVSEVSNFDHILQVTRRLDPKLLELNDKGYLNGHTPFSAWLAWSLSLLAQLTGSGQVLVSNERSSNEGNITYKGVEINHQYSKTWQFEESFRSYYSEVFGGQCPYASFLRPLYELQIAQTFASLVSVESPLLSRFRSCNRGQKTNSWCGECSKCLFAYSLLYPFYGSALTEVFGKELYGDLTLETLALELLGYQSHKPLECVGTYEECKIAWYLSSLQAQAEGKSLPLLEKIAALLQEKEIGLNERTKLLLESWNGQHALNEQSVELLKRVLEEAKMKYPLEKLLQP
jgi:hypothetical protein